MAQIVIRNLDDDVKRRLVARAALAGRSMEEEARQILAAATAPAPEEGLGSRIVRLFKDVGMTEEEHRIFQAAIDESRRSPMRVIDFGQ